MKDCAERSALLGNVLEMDDVHRSAILHPGPIVWASSMMQCSTDMAADVPRDMPRDMPIDMDAFLDGAIRGYETIIAIGETLDDHHYAHWHPTTTAGIFGAASVCAAQLGLSESALVWALGNAGSVTGGLWNMRHENVMTKQWHILHAARTGRDAALAARDGLSGPRQILEGTQGVYAATCKSPSIMSFPEHWRVHDVSFKPWGACRHAHPAIDAALELKGKRGSLDGDIHVETYADAIIFCDRPDPQSVNDAKFSIQHAVAIVAERGVPRLADFEPDAIAALADARSRITLLEAADITARYPAHFGARARCDGQAVELVDTLGDPERPLSEDGIVEKARSLIGWGGLADDEADRAINLSLHGDNPAAIIDMLEDWLA